MEKTKKFKKIEMGVGMKKIVFIFVAFWFIGCAKQVSDEMGTNTTEAFSTVRQAQVYDDTQFSVKSAENGIYTYTFTDKAMPDFKKNEYIVHHEWPSVHLFRKIVALEKNGNEVTLFTVEGNLAEVLPENTDRTVSMDEGIEVCEYNVMEDNTFETVNKMSDEDLKKITAENFLETRATMNGNIQYPVSFNFSGKTIYSDSLFKLYFPTGNVTVTPSLNMKIETSWLKLKYFHVVATVKMDINTRIRAEASGSVTKSFEKYLVNAKRKVYLFYLSGVPVWVDLGVSVKADAHFSSSASAAVNLDFVASYQYTKGQVWNSGKWSDYPQSGFTVPVKPNLTPSWELQANASAYAGLKGEVGFKIYSALGPKLTAVPYLEAEANVVQRTVSWSVYQGFNLDFEIGVLEDNGIIPTEIFGIKLYWAKNLMTYKQKVKEGSYQF